ncbi:uncharacterized protein LOC142356773 [Convolutriloba macropyga]|uniref:uncharacterized protein LOC142356773 n=1 Tax=Convolutriloba macropyga TaxID=536237 RepID=UPI003F52836C
MPWVVGYKPEIAENNNLSPALCVTCHCEPTASSVLDKCENCLEVAAENNSGNNDSSPVDLSMTSKTEQTIESRDDFSTLGSADLPTGQENSLDSSIASAGTIASTSLAYNVLLQRILLASAVASQGSKVGCKKYKCNSCSASFNSKETLGGHMRSYCPSVRPPKLASPNLTPTLPSSRNPITTTSSSTLESSAESPTKREFATTRPKKFKCEKCGVMFSQLSTLQTHQQVYCSGAGKAGPAPGRILSPGTTSSTTTRIDSPTNASLLQRDSDSPTTSTTTSTKEEPNFVTLNSLQNLLVDAKRSQIMANSVANIPPLPLRKRSSPNSDNEGADLKPFAKYQCRNCHIKFNEEKNLEGHEKYYCSARLQSKITRVLSSPRSDEQICEKSSVVNKSPPTAEIQHHSKISNGHCGSSSSIKTAEFSTNHSLAFCDLCEMAISEKMEEHVKSFHKISNKSFIEKIIKLCQNHESVNHRRKSSESELDC